MSRAFPRRTTLVSLVLGAATALIVAFAAVVVAPAASATPDWFHEATGPGLAVTGTYTPIVGNFAGSALDDIIWYAPGAATDYLWTSNGDGTFTKAPLARQVTGTYTPLVGNFGGSSYDDIFWYGPGGAGDSLWLTSGNTFTSVAESVSGTYRPFVVPESRYNSGAYDDIAWYAPGPAADALWVFAGGAGAHLAEPLPIGGSPTPIVGDFDGNHIADILWYTPGAPAESYWRGAPGPGAFTTSTFFLNGTYEPVTGDFSDPPDGRTDILFYGSGAAPDLLLLGSSGSGFGHTTPAMTGSGVPLSISMKYGMVLTWVPGGGYRIWEHLSSGPDLDFPITDTTLSAAYTPIVGTFTTPSYPGETSIFWYAPGPAPEYLFS